MSNFPNNKFCSFCNFSAIAKLNKCEIAKFGPHEFNKWEIKVLAGS